MLKGFVKQAPLQEAEVKVIKIATHNDCARIISTGNSKYKVYLYTQPSVFPDNCSL